MPARTASAASHHQLVVEEFCALIQALHEDGIEAIQARLYERLEVSRSTVSETVALLQDDGYLAVGTPLQLTERGLAIAERTIRRRRLAECFLQRALGLSLAGCRDGAERWQYHMTDEIEAAMIRTLDHPATSPQGNPIPYEPRADPDDTHDATTIALARVAPGQAFTVVRIREELESTQGMLQYLDDAGLRPGVDAVIVAMSPDGTATIETGNERAGLGPSITNSLMVRRRD
ncbi:MAG: metal-dependent transcriptional regulator [Desertimonas sp.]